MIYPATFKYLPLDTLFYGGLTYTAGFFLDVTKIVPINVKIVTSLAVISTIANTLLFEMVNRSARFANPNSKRNEVFRTGLIYTTTNAFVASIAILAAEHLGFISTAFAGCFIFLTAFVFTCRVKVLARPIPG